MIPLLPNEIRARKRPVAVLFLYFAELAWALLIATPVHAWARRAWGAHPDGDAVLFVPGGHDLLLWLGKEDAALPVSFRTMMVLLAVGAVVMQLPLGALLASLAFSRGPTKNADAYADVDADPAVTDVNAGRAPTTVSSLRAGVGAFLPLSALLALGTLVTILVVGIGALASSAVDHGLAESVGDARSYIFRLVTLGFFCAIAAVIGVFVDLARAAIGHEAGTALAAGTSSSAWSMMVRGIKTAGKTSRRAIWRATLAWGGRAVAGVALIALGYVAADMLGGSGGYALFALFLIHQGVVLGRVALRASWMARALSLVTHAQVRAADEATSER